VSERRPGSARKPEEEPRSASRVVSIRPAPRGAPEGGHDEALETKLALTEFLLSSDDLFACAQRAVDWLGEQAGVERALCAAVDPIRGLLVGVAGFGLAPAAVSEVAFDLHRTDAPVVAALAAGKPRLVRPDPAASAFAGALELQDDEPVMVFPLQGRGPRGDVRAGVLITPQIDADAARDVRWLSGVLAQKLASLLSRPDTWEVEAKVREATTELSRQSELLRRQRLALEQAADMKVQFLSGMSHQLRTPLNAILGYTSMLLQGLGGDLGERQRSMLARVDVNARSLLTIVNDVLDISRIEAGSMPICVSEFTVEDLVSSVLAELAPVIMRSNLAVRAELDVPLPRLRTDHAKVKQILLNLVANAIKYTREGSVTLRAALDPGEGLLSVAVCDTGIGIPEAALEKLFEDFQQADNPVNRRHGGAGLGLAICQRLAVLLGGRIAVASSPEIGSTFTLLLRPTALPSAS
jgi:signal transduction histidine kinase